MTINVRCDWPHKINALSVINVMLIRMRVQFRSVSLDLLHPNRRGIECRFKSPCAFEAYGLSFRRTHGDGIITTTSRLCPNRVVELRDFPPNLDFVIIRFREIFKRGKKKYIYKDL